MNLADLHKRLDELESRLDEAIEIERTAAAQRMDALRVLKQHAAKYRGALVMFATKGAKVEEIANGS
jgi:hypothetical protein